jgi:hypothetical protein
MASDFVAREIREGVSRVAFLYGESVINSKNNCCENNIEMNKEDIQKQIEAVRGLIEARNNLTSIVMTRYGGDGEFKDEISTLNDSIRTLTETLKPHLNGEELEV